MKFDQIHHVAIIVLNYEVLKQFYVEKLGFEIIRENYRPTRNTASNPLRNVPRRRSS